MPDAHNRRSDNLPPLTLHVPEPRFRPGDTPDFSDIAVLPAGATPRPPENVKPADIIGHAYGRASGFSPWWTAGTMVVLGLALVAITIALGG